MSEALRWPTAAEVGAARANIMGFARRTPLWRLDAETPGMNIWLKLENLQPLGSFKIRAAVNAIRTQDPGALKAGVVGASAGNFGLGLALAGRKLGAPVTIVAPDTASSAKISALQGLGARVIRLPFEAWWRVLEARRCEGVDGVFFHPVADRAVIAGNATIGVEILEDLDRFDAVVVPFGGGGLVSGIASILRRERPGLRVIAAEADTARPAAAALASGHPIRVEHSPSFVDGIGSGVVLEEMWPLVRASVDVAAGASLAEISAAIRLIASRCKVIAEGAGATALAATLAGRAGDGDIVCIVSGGNIDMAKLGPIIAGHDPI